MQLSQPPLFRSSEQIAQLVHDFEAGTLAPDQFDHHAHMTVALWYLAQLPFAAAAATMRAHIQRFAAAHHQSQLYHETITIFWMRLLRHVLDSADPHETFPDVVQRALSTFGTMQVFFRHYSKEYAFGSNARQHWVEPDLLPLPFPEPDMQ